MIKVKLNNRTYKIPDRFTLDQYKAIVNLDAGDNKNWPVIMGIGLNQPTGRFIKADEDSLLLGASLIIHSLAQRIEAPHRDFTTLTFGEFIDLDIYMVLGMDQHLDDILKIIGTQEYSANEALYIIDQFANFRITTYRSYSGLFGLNSKGEQEDVDPEEFNPKKVSTGWYKVIVDLADDDLLRIDPITDQPLNKTLTFMSLRKEKALAEQKRQLEQKRKHDISRNRK